MDKQKPELSRSNYQKPPSPNKTEMQYKITQSYQKDGKWFVTYKVWPKGECFCMAVKKKVELIQEKSPTVEDIKRVENA